jgi:RNA polymerase sigma factor (sigma-70 family)
MTKLPSTPADALASRFEVHRLHLRGTAYRLLGSLAEADDVVQDAWLRTSRADTSGIDNLGAWLTTIVARLCLDRLRARTSRREDSLDFVTPDPVISDPEGSRPEQEALLADSVGLALLIVLEALSPAERLAFVLHDTLGLPFEEIAPIVRRNVAATRQLASRARRRVRGARPSVDVPLARQWELVDAFLAAARDGDLDALVRVLDPNVVARADFGPGPSSLGRSRVSQGAREVAQQAAAFRNFAPGARRVLVNGAPGFFVTARGKPYAVLGMAFGTDGITEIDILLDPDRLARLELPTGANRSLIEVAKP